jgi:hypothetical protein
MNPPNEDKLRKAGQKLRGRRPGTQVAVGGGIYMRLDSSSRRRFQFRVRVGDNHIGGTYDSWEEAHDARSQLEAQDEPARNGNAGPGTAEMRSWTVERYTRKAWWETVLLDCDDLTQADYERGLNDLLPHLRGVTMADLESSPLLIDRLKKELKKEKTYVEKHRGLVFHKAAADKPLKVLSALATHAVKRNVLKYNPMAGVSYFNVRRSSSGNASAASHRPILPSEVKRPITVIQTTVGMRGSPARLAERRTVPELIMVGMRPSDICAMRHNWWRDENGALRYIRVDAAVKDLRGHLLEGEPKTGERNLYLFDAIAERLEWIYQLQGRPPLDSLVIPDTIGGLLDWGNWRTRVWYPSLHLAGLAKGPHSYSEGAFWPYVLRHIGVTIMLHAQRPEGGTYSEREVARQFGHTVQTLDRVYADIPEDMHGIAGLTMDEIIRTARREVWGPMPGDADYQPVEYDLRHAAELTGIDHKALAARIQRGSLPGSKHGGRYRVTRFDLVWHGLIPLTAPPGV